MHYSAWTNRILGVVLVLLLCAGILPAQTRKSSNQGTKTATKGKTSSRKASAAKRSARKTSKKTSKKTPRKGKRTMRARGQQGIDAARARQIQEALIRENYLDGEATGVWDQRTRDAMTRYQADHGWQTKVLPDSRALIKLGLGPDHSNLLNPDTAATPATASAGRQR